MSVIDLVEQGRIPDFLTRTAIRRLLRARLAKEHKRYQSSGELKRFIEQMSSSPLAINTPDANTQHYEVPTAFYDQVLGKHKKYSCCYFDANVEDLSTAEAAMLKVSNERAGLENGIDILELGCGWGSLTLWMGKHYPDSRITAVSNSYSHPILRFQRIKL